MRKLPQRYSDVWDLFRGLKSTRDAERVRALLADEALRIRFYERLSAYARTLQIALSSAKFIEETANEKLDRYRAT